MTRASIVSASGSLIVHAEIGPGFLGGAPDDCAENLPVGAVVDAESVDDVGSVKPKLRMRCGRAARTVGRRNHSHRRGSVFVTGSDRDERDRLENPLSGDCVDEKSLLTGKPGLGVAETRLELSGTDQLEC